MKTIFFGTCMNIHELENCFSTHIAQLTRGKVNILRTYNMNHYSCISH